MKRVIIWTSLVAVAWPGTAGAEAPCCGGKIAVVVADAGLEMKLLITLLWLGLAASLAVWLLSPMRKTGKARGAEFVGALRSAGPLLGAAGAVYVLGNGFVDVMFDPPANPFADFAPGLAEASLALWSGLLAGGVAALVHPRLRAPAGVTPPR